MKTPKQEANELVEKFCNSNQEDYCLEVFESSIQMANISISDIISFIKRVINQTQEVHQSINSPILMCKDILNPLLEHYEQVKLEIQKL